MTLKNQQKMSSPNKKKIHTAKADTSPKKRQIAERLNYEFLP